MSGTNPVVVAEIGERLCVVFLFVFYLQSARFDGLFQIVDQGDFSNLRSMRGRSEG